MNDNTREAVQQVIGWLAAIAFLLLAAASMTPAYELTPPVIIGTVIVIAMLLGKIDAIADLIDSWRQ